MKKQMYIVAASLVLALIAVFVMPRPAQQPVATPVAAPAVELPSITPEGLRGMISARVPMFILDVRQPEEFAQDHIEGATLIPLGELESRLAEIPQDKKVVVYCRTGARSATAVKLLGDKGFANVVNLVGGMEAWTGAPVVETTVSPDQATDMPETATPAAGESAVPAAGESVVVPTTIVPAAPAATMDIVPPAAPVPTTEPVK